ncbi:MAG: hypothetical protein Q9227_004322 [Pyrenula ochraceoflavens]
MPDTAAALQPSAEDYTVAIICPIMQELTAMRQMLDKQYPTPAIDTEADDNSYTCGSINGHSIVIACLGQWNPGISPAAQSISLLSSNFRRIRTTLLVGIGGGMPPRFPASQQTTDVRLGDVVIGWDGNKRRAIIYQDSPDIIFPPPDTRILKVLTKLASNLENDSSVFQNHLRMGLEKLPLRSRPTYEHPGVEKDRLYEAGHPHAGAPDSPCDSCGDERTVKRPKRETAEFEIHRGTIVSMAQVLKNAALRDCIRDKTQALCVEMEAAGISDRKNCLVIRGISDYADGHKNDQWKGYAAMTAAAVAREILCVMDPGMTMRLAVTGE